MAGLQLRRGADLPELAGLPAQAVQNQLSLAWITASSYPERSKMRMVMSLNVHRKSAKPNRIKNYEINTVHPLRRGDNSRLRGVRG